VVVDFSRLTFMDAAGVGVLVGAHSRLVGEGREGLVIRGASGIVRRSASSAACLHFSGTASRWHRAATSPPRASAERWSWAAAMLGCRSTVCLSRTSPWEARQNFGQLVAYLDGDAATLDSHQCDVLVHAVNERLGDVGRADHLLSYASA
jgi:hypothetical protein